MTTEDRWTVPAQAFVVVGEDAVMIEGTGQVLDAGELGELIAEREERASLLRIDLARAVDEARAARDAFRALVPPEGWRRLDDGRLVVRRADRRTPRRPNAERCDERREVLLGLGLGMIVETYKPPNVSSIDAAADELRLTGIDPASLIVPPGSAPGPVDVVETPKREGT